MLRVFVSVLLASIAFVLFQWLTMSVIISWLMQSNPSAASLALIFVPPSAFFIVYFFSTILLLNLAPVKVGLAALLQTILSPFLYSASWGIVHLLVPFLWFLQTLPTP